MQVQVINKHAQAEYAALVARLEHVRGVLEAVSVLVDRYQDPVDDDGGINWRLPSQDDLWAARNRAANALVHFRAQTKKYEARLLSRTWRV